MAAGISLVPPLKGLGLLLIAYPGLPPWAKFAPALRACAITRRAKFADPLRLRSGAGPPGLHRILRSLILGPSRPATRSGGLISAAPQDPSLHSGFWQRPFGFAQGSASRCSASANTTAPLNALVCKKSASAYFFLSQKKRLDTTLLVTLFNSIIYQ